MKLTELDPKWLMFEGRRVGIIFRSPLFCKRDWWQTCFFEKFYLFKSRDGHYYDDEKGFDPDSQHGIIEACCPEALNKFAPCNPECAWSVIGDIESQTFDTLTITPSIDGSNAGLWHGFCTNGIMN